MFKVVIYCQSVEGVGHWARSVRIANELGREFAVTLVNGGPALPLRPKGAVKVVQLDPLWMREGKLADPSGVRPVEEIFASRRAKLASLGPFDAAVVELFPFGRKKFAGEILGFLSDMRAKNPGLKAISSVRDVLVEKKEDRSAAVAEAVRQNFDMVWVHSDPQLLKLNFPLELLGEKAVYTGFVAEPPRKFARGKEPLIVVSAGGGFRGRELFLAAMAAMPEFPQYRFHFVFGPHAGYRAEIEEKLKPFGDQAHSSGLVEDFEGLLARSALSISMGGYNTSFNLLRAHAQAVVHPFAGDQEQGIRAEALEKKGYLAIVRDLSALPSVMRSRLNTVYPNALPDLNGSARSRGLLLGLLEQK
jgi:predicted glycosyltransferase